MTAESAALNELFASSHPTRFEHHSPATVMEELEGLPDLVAADEARSDVASEASLSPRMNTNPVHGPSRPFRSSEAAEAGAISRPASSGKGGGVFSIEGKAETLEEIGRRRHRDWMDSKRANGISW